MTDRLGMGFGQMERLIGTLQNATSAISGRLDRLDEQVAVLRGAWTGEASDAYDRAQRTNREQLREMNRILRSSGTATDQIRARHAAAADAVEKLWG